MTRSPLISDLLLELDDGTRVVLDPSLQVPVGLALDGGENGNRAPDRRVVVRSGDEIGAAYTVTGTGKVYGTTPTETLDRLDELWRQLRRARKLWRAERCYLKLHYALLPQAQMGFGYLSASVTPIYRLAYLGWLRVDPVTGQEEEVFG